MTLLDEGVLRFLECVSLIGGDAFPACREWPAAGRQTLEISGPWETSLRDETLHDAHLAGHLIRTIRNTTRISDARGNYAWSAPAGFVLC